MKNFIGALVFSFFGVGVVSAQMYVPIDTANLELRTNESKVYEEGAKFNNSIDLEDYKNGERSLFKKRCEGMNKVMKEDLLSGKYVFDIRFKKMMDSIVSEISNKNIQLPLGLNFYMARDNTLNASSLGNKYFVVNMGAFYFLQNEDQLSAIICHEIAHYLLKHVLKDIQYQYKLKKQADLKNEISMIKENNENKSDKAYNKLKNLLYKEGDLNKQQEYEADSLGYVLYKNTRYKRADYINSFKLQQAYDTIRPLGLHLDTYRKVFSLPAQPFKDEWLKMEDFSKYDYSKFKAKYNEDSLSSHPDTELRINALLKSFPELAIAEKEKEATAEFDSLSTVAKFEQPRVFEFEEEYGVGVYFCLFRLQQKENVAYYNNRLGVLFQKIYEARKEYTLNRYLERLDPKDQSASYQQFLSFMWNLNLQELKNIADYYKETRL